MKKLLLSTAAVAALAFAGTAKADLQIGVSEDGGPFTLSGTSTTGGLTFNPTLANFGGVRISTTGVPVETTPDLATTDLSAENATAAPHTLTVDVFQTNISAPAGTSMGSVFTVNNLIEPNGTGAATLSDFTNGTSISLGTPLHSQPFPAGTINATIRLGPTLITPPITADAQEFVVTFNSGQTISDTIQTVGVPEPPTWAMFGLGILLLGWWNWKRRQGKVDTLGLAA